jgi:NhaA family Na+:H+ antiporter
MTTVLTKLFREFFESEKTGGFVLLGCTVLSLVLANSGVGEGYIAFWNAQAGGHTIVEWINDALMAVFFLLIGLELEREIYQGELSDLGSASLPIIAAVGGMLVPAGIHLALNAGTATQSGAGIPMATDIAFAIGILSLLGNRVPASLKVFLTALAVIDDLGAIIIIAVAYSGGIQFSSLLIALGIFAVLLVLNRLRVYNLVPYLAGGVVMWYFMLQSGVHATITGVLLAFAIPFGNGGEKSPSYILQHILHKPVAFFILPVFALANTCIPIAGNVVAGLLQSNSIGIMAGLLIGKPAGISLFSFLAVRMRLATLPDELKWNYIAGTGLLGGIGFTMSIFIALLAFDDGELINGSKIAVLVGSLLAGGIGYVLLNLVLPKNGEVDS